MTCLDANSQLFILNLCMLVVEKEGAWEKGRKETNAVWTTGDSQRKVENNALNIK